MPGTSTALPNCVRPVGIVLSTSEPITVCCRAFWTSTTGDSPVTVMVSFSSPTRRSALTVAANAPASSMPSRLKVLKPGSEKVTE